MVNNRVFEALACGAAFVSDHFPAAESLFGAHVAGWAKAPGDVPRHVRRLLRAHHPDVVLGLGGYAAFPGSVMAWMCLWHPLKS